jgi:hypothetical protein
MQQNKLNKVGIFLESQSKVSAQALPWMTCQAKNLTFFGTYTFHKEEKTDSPI